MVAAGVADEMLVQLAYAIGVAQPVSVYVDTFGRSKVQMSDGEIAKKIKEMFDLRPRAIERMLKLRQPMYLETAAYGHMGRKNEVVKKTFTSHYHESKTIDVELFTWEKLVWTKSSAHSTYNSIIRGWIELLSALFSTPRNHATRRFYRKC